MARYQLTDGQEPLCSPWVRVHCYRVWCKSLLQAGLPANGFWILMTFWSSRSVMFFSNTGTSSNSPGRSSQENWFSCSAATIERNKDTRKMMKEENTTRELEVIEFTTCCDQNDFKKHHCCLVEPNPHPVTISHIASHHPTGSTKLSVAQCNNYPNHPPLL